jgi:hypothetical protein
MVGSTVVFTAKKACESFSQAFLLDGKIQLPLELHHQLNISRQHFCRF